MIMGSREKGKRIDGPEKRGPGDAWRKEKQNYVYE